jgi:ABC-type amino acid transport substrate-binding protein
MRQGNKRIAGINGAIAEVMADGTFDALVDKWFCGDM